MTRSALSSPSTPDRAADVRRAALDRAPRPEGDFHDGPELRPTHAAMRFVTLRDQGGGPIAPRGPAEGAGADPPAGTLAGARVIIIGCEHRLFVHTRSKNWAMTVGQTGWVHPSRGQKTETMIPYVASRVRSGPRAVASRRAGPPSGARRDDWGRGRPGRRPLTVIQAIVVGLEGQTYPRRPGRSMNQAPAGYWGAGSPLCAPMARGVRYNWKGPPTELPLRAPRSLPTQGRIQFRVH
jgi:hypothetical protein